MRQKNSFKDALVDKNMHIPNLINEIATSYIFQSYRAVDSNIFRISKSTLSSTAMILGRHAKFMQKAIIMVGKFIQPMKITY